MEFSTKERNIIREIKVDDIHYIPSQIDFFRTSQLFVTILSSQQSSVMYFLVIHSVNDNENDPSQSIRSAPSER